MPPRPLTQVRVSNLKPRKSVRNLRDGALKGFGVRILPSGRKRFFVHSQTDGRRIWKIIGDADAIPLDEARRQATDLLGAIRSDGDGRALPQETVFEAVAEEVFRNYGRHWKPRTLKVNRGYLRNQILPWFRGRNVADIAQADVQPSPRSSSPPSGVRGRAGPHRPRGAGACHRREPEPARRSGWTPLKRTVRSVQACR